MSLRPQILYVDDEENNLFAFKSVFRRTYNIITASGGIEAIQVLENEKVDLVLSDQRMPEMTGVDLCKYVMKNYPSAKRMIVTGYSDEETLQEAITFGVISKSISKPWEVEELKKEIDLALAS